MQQQNMNTQNQQGIMQQPPAVISTKDALYLTDMLSWNLLACKKAHFYAQQCQDQELKIHFEQCGQMHQRHYEQLLAHFNQQNQQNFMGMQ
ncbi:hypothetical protein AF332_06095 [Sporosarcina globispora]|uniref:Coat protein F n=1 Tax=Sporosarcina globispora TaxID=1459 RepID=A0A0M0GAH7_SPOGL|nr:hypothetical protein [Sporosarcina globispora]KON86436.1 hypothetical protein AF332_06095 [Sporosarcina globispora]